MAIWDRALFTRAIRNAAVHGDTDNYFVYKIYIAPGMFLS